jgi:hypothetical protein
LSRLPNCGKAENIQPGFFGRYFDLHTVPERLRDYENFALESDKIQFHWGASEEQPGVISVQSRVEWACDPDDQT